MKLGIADIIALVKAGYKMSDIKALQEVTLEEPEAPINEVTPGEPEAPINEVMPEEPEAPINEVMPEEKPSVEDLKNQIRDLNAQIKTIQENNKEADVSHHTDEKKPTDNELMLDLFRTFM